MRKIRAKLLDKEKDLRRLELKLKQEREAGDLQHRLDPKRLVDAVNELAEKNKKKDYRPPPAVKNEVELKHLLATDFQRKILSELDSKRDKVQIVV